MKSPIGTPLIFNPKASAADVFRSVHRQGMSIHYAGRWGYRVVRRNNTPPQAA